jgi:hypothetical protein
MLFLESLVVLCSKYEYTANIRYAFLLAENALNATVNTKTGLRVEKVFLF